jgi:hypothetical protein
MPDAPARALLRRGQQLDQLTRPVVACEQELRKQVGTAFAALRQQMVRRELATIPIARLRETTAGRLRLGQLEKAGFGTVLAILDASPYCLQQVPGVGTATAAQAVAAARQVAAAVDHSLKVQIDLDPANPQSTGLLTALYQLGQAEPILARLAQPARQLDEELRVLLPKAKLAASRLRLIFAGQGAPHRGRACTDPRAAAP